MRDNETPNVKISIASTQFLRARTDLENPENLIPKTPNWLVGEFSNSVDYKPTLAMRWPHMNVGKQYELAFADGEDINYCDHPINTVTIRANGDIVPCCYDLTSQLIMGNIMDGDLHEIFNGKKYEHLRTSIKEKKYMSLCKDCNTVRPHAYLIKPKTISLSKNDG